MSIAIPPKVYRAKQIAETFGIGLSSVWRLAKEGKLTPLRVSPRTTVFNADEVHRYFKIKKEEVEQ